MTTRDFKVFLEPDLDYGGYVVVCPSLPGCYSQGKSVSEALANIREAIELVLEDMESRGEEIRKRPKLAVLTADYVKGTSSELAALQGKSSSMRLTGWSAMRVSTSRK